MGEWIKVSERLPSMEDDEVLFHSKMGGFHLGEWDGKNWHSSDGTYVAGVTHWMPLPAPPY